MMFCTQCGKEFTGRKRKYCSKKCRLLVYGNDPDYKPEPNCLVCSKILIKGQKKYCSGACCSTAYYIRKHPDRLPQQERREVTHKNHLNKTQRICRQCGELFTMVRHSKGIFCSYKCRGAWRSEQPKKPKAMKPLKHCKVCGKEISKRGCFCSRECRLKDARDYYYSNHAASLERAKVRYITIERSRRTGKHVNQQRKCKWCGELFALEYGDKRRSYCSATCRKRSERWAKHSSDWAYLRDKVEREGERFRVQDIYIRDKWICQICHSKVDQRLKYPHPKSASLDHIIPIALGGIHTRENVQLAHLDCNVKAGVGGVKQVRMFG